jgi:hypothetical protein
VNLGRILRKGARADANTITKNWSDEVDAFPNTGNLQMTKNACIWNVLSDRAIADVV